MLNSQAGSGPFFDSVYGSFQTGKASLLQNLATTSTTKVQHGEAMVAIQYK